MPCDKDQKILYENCIIFVVDLRLFFLLIYEFQKRQEFFFVFRQHR
jgi:hypothetical protein